MDFNARKAQELTNTVKETNRVLKNVSEQNFLWGPITRSIQNGRNTVVMTIYNEREVNFVNELKELGYKVTIEEKRFYNEAIISWVGQNVNDMTPPPNNPKITIGTKIRSKTNPDEILCIISNDCHGDKFECADGSVLSLKQIEKYYDIII